MIVSCDISYVVAYNSYIFLCSTISISYVLSVNAQLACIVEQSIII